MAKEIRNHWDLRDRQNARWAYFGMSILALVVGFLIFGAITEVIHSREMDRQDREIERAKVEKGLVPTPISLNGK